MTGAPWEASSDIRIIIASCCRSDRGTGLATLPGVLGVLIRLGLKEDSILRLPRLRFSGVFLSGKESRYIEDLIYDCSCFIEFTKQVGKKQ